MSPEFTIYVVDDDPSIRSAFEIYFALRGIRVRSYPSAAQLLDDREECWRGCAFLDIRMPAMSGQELHRAMRQIGIEVPIVFMTGHENADSLRSEFGADIPVLRKPFAAEELDAAVRWCCPTAGLEPA